jgi:hypothetical protein
MARSCVACAVLAVFSFAGIAHAQAPDSLAVVPTAHSDPWWKLPLSSRARLDLRLVADQATAPWSWDAQSRSPLDYSRFMIDATLGGARTGTLYAKGAASWQDADQTDGEVAFGIEQGDYLYRFAHAELRAFGDERRFFTYDLGTALMDDDVVDNYQHRVGVRADGGTEQIGGSLLVSSLDQGAETQLVSYAKARTAWRPFAAAVSHKLEEGDGARDHAVVKGEVAAFWKQASAIASLDQTGFGSGVFLPELDWGNGYGSKFVELRLAGGKISDAIAFSGVYRYRRTYDYYQNALSSLRAGTSLNRLGLYLSHRQYALDGRVVVFEGEGPAQAVVLDREDRGVAASARAFLNDNSEMNLRGAMVESDYGPTTDERTTGVVHASYRRSLQRFMGGVDALVDEIGKDAVTRVGLETRINWNATSALYLRWMVSNAVERADAVYARLEFRPTARTWVTIAYGRDTTGDGPYFLEDEDALPTIDTEDVVTITVRGDF